MDWIYRRGVGDFQQMSNFPKSLRQQLARLGSCWRRRSWHGRMRRMER